MGTISKGGNGAKRSNSLLRFGAWDVLIEDKFDKVSSEGFWKEPQLENTVHNAVMWDSLFCVTRIPPNHRSSSHPLVSEKNIYAFIYRS